MEKENSRTRERTHFRTDTRPAMTAGESASAQARSNFTRHAPLEPGIPATASLSTQAVRWLDGASTERQAVIGCAFQGRAKFEVLTMPSQQGTGPPLKPVHRLCCVRLRPCPQPSMNDARRTMHNARRRLVRRVTPPSLSPSMRRRSVQLYGQKPVSRRRTLVPAPLAHPSGALAWGWHRFPHGSLRDKPLWGAESAFEILHAARRTSRQPGQGVVAGIVLAARANLSCVNRHTIFGLIPSPNSDRYCKCDA
jgi:hypothetical protein